MNTAPPLSVCIPTFNRLHYLKVALASLLPQAQFHGIQVCISDNHSTDGTAEFLSECKINFPWMQYIIQEKNIGLDRNMIAAIGMCSGRYVYPVGDDDLLPDGALADILKELENECDLLILNGWHTTPNLTPVRQHLSDSASGISFDDPTKAFITLWDKMPFGSFVASRECFQAHYFDRYVGTSHAYTGAVWDALADTQMNQGYCRVRCMLTPTVMLRGGEKTWRNDAALIMLYEIPHWFTLLMEKGSYRGCAREIRDDYLKKQTKFSRLLQYRALGQLELSNVDKLGKECTAEQVKRLIRVARLSKTLAGLLVNTLSMLRTIVNKSSRN